MPPPNPATTVTNPRIAKLIELEVAGKIKPEHKTELETYRAQGLAPKRSSGNSLTEYQGKSTGFYERASGADRDFLAAGVGGSPVGYAGDIARTVLPENIVNSNTSPERQKAEQAKMDFILASLRYESGAAIGPQEYINQEKTFFPQTGDSAEKIAQKAKARERVIESLKVAAGPGVAAPTVTDVPEVPAGAGDPVASATGEGQTITPEDREFQRQANELIRSGATRADLEALGAKFGRTFEGEYSKALDDALANPSGGFSITPSGRKEASTLGAMAATPVGSFFGSAGDALTLGFQDEIAGLAGGDTGQARLALDAMRENNPISSGAGSLVGGSLIPIGRGASTIRELATVGGGMGAIYGIGSGTDARSRGEGAVIGGLTGAAVGAGLSKLGDLYRARRGPPPSGPTGGGAADVAQASSDLNVPMMAADVGGTPASLATSFMRMTPGGAQPITSAARRSQDAAGDALSTIAAREGQAMDREAAGEAVRQGSLQYRNESRDAVGRIYTRAADAAGDARISPTRALEELDRNISELEQVPGGIDGLRALQSLRDDIANRGEITVDGIRGMRTQLRQKFMSEGLRGSDLERRVNGVVDAASEDVMTSLNAQGKGEAARLYSEADRQWADRVKTLDDVIMPIIGRKGEKSGEQITAALNSAAKGNNARLSKLFDALPAQEAGAARASMIEGLGKANPGAQGASGDSFSFGTFLTNWNKIGNSAKNAMFSGENRKSIDQLALLAEKSKNAAKWQNYSNTGIGVLGVATGATGAGGIGALAGTVAAQYGLGRLLASPRVAKAILNIAQAKTPSAISSRVGNLSSLAARETALASEITGLQSRLQQAMNDNISSAAASGEQKNDR